MKINKNWRDIGIALLTLSALGGCSSGGGGGGTVMSPTFFIAIALFRDVMNAFFRNSYQQ